MIAGIIPRIFYGDFGVTLKTKLNCLAIFLGCALLPVLGNASPERGWWFYQTPPKPPKIVKPRLPVPSQPVSTQSAQPIKNLYKNPCKHASTWTVKCGFVNPGTSFSFQAKERDALMQDMVMNPQNPNAVMQFQKYNQWLTNEAIQVANMWYWNDTQHPSLDPQSTNPISEFGLQLAEKVKRNDQDDIFKYLRKHGLFFYFSRQSCFYCHAMAPNVRDLQQDTGVPVEDMSLSTSGCLPGFQGHCKTAPETIKPAEILHVKTVPALFLFVKPNTWIRIGTGVVDEHTLQARIVDFVAAYRTAILKGVHNGNGTQPSVDFQDGGNPYLPGGNGAGVKSTKGKLPTAEEIKKLLGAP